MAGISRKKRAQNAESKEQMRKKISFTKAFNRINACEQELMRYCDIVPGSRVSALKVVMDSNWKKIDKLLPNPQQIAVEGEIVHRDASSLTDEELANIATGSSERAITEAGSKKDLH